MPDDIKIFEPACRLTKLPPYLFVEVDRMKKEAIARGEDIINLGVGDPDTPTPGIVIDVMKKALEDTENHQYPFGEGKENFRKSIKKFMKERFSLSFDSEKQIHTLIGSKEGIAHLPLAFVNKSDIVLVPEPAYPVYNSASIFAGGRPYFMPLTEDNGFLPDYDSIPASVLDGAKIMFINYPNNPTGAGATEEFYEKTVHIAKKHSIIVASDAAYSELYYSEKPPSFLQFKGAMDVGIEFHSLSKTFSMTGWRVGWACGNEHIVEGLASVKNNTDSGVFGAVQDAAAVALDNYAELAEETRRVYGSRVKIMSEALKEASWRLDEPLATFYIWAKPPVDINSGEAVKKIISEAGIVCTPGSGFGPSGEGFVRFAATRNEERIRDAVERLKKIDWQ